MKQCFCYWVLILFLASWKLKGLVRLVIYFYLHGTWQMLRKSGHLNAISCAPILITVFDRSETMSEVSWRLYEMSELCRQMHCLQRRLQVCKDTLLRTFDFWIKTVYCNVGFFCSLAGMTCVPECINGTFFHLEEMKCIPCHSFCRTCTGMCSFCSEGEGHQVNIWSFVFKFKVIQVWIYCDHLFPWYVRHPVLLEVLNVCSSGPGTEGCIQCAEGYLQQEWRCVQTCAPGYYSGEAAGVPHKMCHRWV